MSRVCGGIPRALATTPRGLRMMAAVFMWCVLGHSLFGAQTIGGEVASSTARRHSRGVLYKTAQNYEL